MCSKLKDRIASSKGEGGQKELQKLRYLQAQSVVADDEVPLLPEGLKKKGQKRRHKSRAAVQLQNCTICGSADHKMNPCGQKWLVTVGSKCLKSLALQKVKKLAAVVAMLKYTPLHQRTSAYNKRPTLRSRAQRICGVCTDGTRRAY